MSRGLMGIISPRRWRAYVSFLTVLLLLVADIFWFVDWGLFRASDVESAAGDFSVFREAAGGTVVAGASNIATWDTVVSESVNIDLQANTSDIDLVNSGRYLVLYNAWTHEGGSGGSNRRSIASYLTLNGAPLEYGWGSGYIRDAENDLVAYNSGAAIINAAAGDDLALVLERDDGNPGGGTEIRDGTNGISLLKLDDSLDYLRIHSSAGESNIQNNTSFTAVTWDSVDEVDTGSFSFSSPGSGVTVRGSDTQKFLVTANVKLNVPVTNGTRQNYELRLALDGVEIPGTRTTAYLRNINDTLNSTLQYVGIIEKTAVGDQVLTIEVRRESVSGTDTNIVGDETAVAMVALPSDAKVLSLTSTANQALTTTPSALAFGNQISTSNALSHSTTTNPENVTVSLGGDYLALSTSYTSRSSGGNREAPRIDWLIDGATQPYGGHGSYNRGDQGTDDTFTAGASGGAIFPGLVSSQVIALSQVDETTGTVNAEFPADRVAMQLVPLTELNPSATTNVILNATQRSTSSVPVTNQFSGDQFALIESDAPRNVTNIILSESGSIDAQSGLANVRLLYDLDTTSPYDCLDETFDGSESQFGSTGSFSGPDGSITFSGSVSIAPATAFCGYIVYDVTDSAQDGETINFEISNPSTDITVTAGGSVTPANPVGDGDSTVIENPEITQTGYHWRNDDGDEVSASSATGGSENTPALSFSTSTPQRLRVGVAGTGTGSATKQFRLEYGAKVTTCAAVSSWSDVGGSGGAWDMFDSSNLTEGADTTNIAVSTGGISDGGVTFITANGGVRDTSSETGPVTIRNEIVGTIAEFGNVSVTNGSTTTITLNNTYDDPVVVASARYPRSATQRTTRISDKTGSSFTVLVDNFDGSLGAGTSAVDYVVFEAGDWDLSTDAGTLQVYAGTTSTAVSDGRVLLDDPGGASVTYPRAFVDPVVLLSLTSSNDPDWGFAQAYGGTNVDNPPTSSGFTAFINDNWDADGHTATETIDYIVFEAGAGTNNTVDFAARTTGSANVPSTPTTVSLGATYTATPAVILVQALTQLGSDGGFAQVDTNSPPTVSAVTISTDEDGFGADRGHAAEEVAVVSFAADGDFTNEITDENEFVELEYALQATNAAVEGVAYCFRVTDAGDPLRSYTVYPEATVSADVTVGSVGVQQSDVNQGTSTFYMGGAFSVVGSTATRTVTEIMVTETAAIDAGLQLANPQLAYDLDTSAPYDCGSETYDGTEPLVAGTAFAAPNGTSTFSLSQQISATQALCAYLIVDVASTTANGTTIDFAIQNPNSDVTVTGASVGPGSVVELSGSTVVNGPSLTQTGYHWRNNDGDEAAASSATAGSENTAIDAVFQGSIRRLRVGIHNEGVLAKTGAALRLEYGTKVTTCAEVGVWQRVDTGPAFEMASTSLLVDGDDTTDIGTGAGGVTNPATSTFVSANSGQLEDSDESAATSIAATEFIELEYALLITEASAFGATYCFRVTDAGAALPTYAVYGELSVQDRQDFFVQRGTATVSGTSTTLVAGVDYTPPSSPTSAFVRITNTSMTGAGSDTLGSTRQPDDLTAYIEDPGNLTSSFTIARPAAATDNTRVSWEIIEYIGVPGGDNEMIVRSVDTITYGGSDLTATGTPVTSVVDDTAVVVFITGQLNPATSVNDYNTGQSISDWVGVSDEPVFERGDADGIAASISYAVVEFTGANWQVQRAEHTYSAAGTTEFENISPVNSLARTFLHTQKIAGDELVNLDENGHEVWLSSIGTVSFELESGSSNPSQQTSVAWVIENTQAGTGALMVYRSNGIIAATSGQPNTYLYNIGGTVVPENASIWANNRSSGPGSAHPRVLLGARIVDEAQFELWKSDEGQNQTFRVEVVEWPVADTSIRQVNYRFYEDNNSLTPTDPWPPGPANLGENAAMTDVDSPLGEGERVRIRMALFVNNASLAAEGASFNLEYGRRDTTCSAISAWQTVGGPGSGAIWRGVDAGPGDGATLPSTVLSVSNIAGTYEESNPSAVNPTAVDIGEYVEYDWLIENNGALQRSSYCFRMVENDGALLAGYDVFPTVRTSGYTAVIDNWRWFDDENNLTPTTALAGERVAPSNISNGNALKLRVSVAEIESADGENIKFNLEYSEYADFRDGGTQVTATSACSGNSLWCYFDGAGTDNELIETAVLTGVDSCVASTGTGCGTRNEAIGLTSSYDQPALTTSEHEFTIVHDGARANAVYYFRLVDATNGVDLIASSTYPSLLVEGPILTFDVEGLAAGTAVEGVITDATSTPTGINFGRLPVDTDVEAAQRLTVFTNGTEGYQVFMTFDQDLLNTYGNAIQSIVSTNDAPTTWESQCTSTSSSCFGYHVGDNVLFGGSVRFALDNSYAGVESQPVEVMASNVPVTFDVSEVVYRVRVTEQQPAGDYTTAIQYIIVPKF